MAKKKKKINEEDETITTKDLPEDLIRNIISWLPVKSLLRFRCVCKAWCALIADPAFVKMHLSRSVATNSNISLFFKASFNFFSLDLDNCEQKALARTYPLKSLNSETMSGVKILGSCNGLLCLSRSHEDICLWNPSIRRNQKLPIAPFDFPIPIYDLQVVYGFGYDPTTDDYKLVRFVRHSGGSKEVKVYSLRTNSWRRIRDMPLNFEGIYGFGLFANTALHWVNRCSRFIVSFDVKDEEYGELPLPDFVAKCFYHIFHCNVSVLRGQLCLACTFSRVAEVWIMKDYGVKDSWEKHFSIDDSWTTSLYAVKPLCYSKNGEVILQNDRRGRISEVPVLYNPHSGKVRVRTDSIRGISYLGSNHSYAGVIDTNACVGSLVPLNAKDETEQPEKAQKRHRKQNKKKITGAKE